MRVACYYNLRRHCFSIKALEGPSKGRVIGHADEVVLTDVAFKVSQAGRERVLKEQRKNVHAYVIGNYADIYNIKLKPGSWEEVRYNPYTTNCFFDNNRRAVNWADVAVCRNKRVVAYNAS